MTDQDKSKIIIDEDWKTQVERERDEIKAKGDDETPAASEATGDIPPASFPMLVTSIGTQAMMALGQVPDPMSGQAVYHPDLARHHIDTLVMLQEKTTGNLTPDETEMLQNFVHQLQHLFVTTQSNVTVQPPSPETTG